MEHFTAATDKFGNPLIPPSGIALAGITIVLYIDDNGEQKINWDWAGDGMQGISFLGMLEAAKMAVWEDILNDGDSDE